MARVCVVDDKEILRDSLSRALVREDHEVTAFGDSVEALAQIKEQRFDVVLCDLKMPQLDGLSLAGALREAGCDTPIIIVTAYATVQTAVDAMKLGAFDYIQKPFEADQVAVLVERALEHARLKRDNEALRASVEDLNRRRPIIGTGPAMTALRHQLDRVAASHETVLITGESGTGKELAAQFIHRASPRSDRPMLCLNCAALSANLLESELFGHERGAFTGADRTRKGRFELADGGTLLLDEISEMDVALQAKLLRVLQEGEFERVGSSATRRADVRVIATTNRDLADWVKNRRFRGDLYYRLNVLPVRLPPLRDHVRDIPELVEHFLAQAAREGHGTRWPVTPDALRLMKEYEWPGNVRELENICRRAATLCSGKTITRSLIEPWLAAGVETTVIEGCGPLREGRMLEDMERQVIQRTLNKYNGHRARTANALGMGVRTLGMRLKQWREETEQRPLELVRSNA